MNKTVLITGCSSGFGYLSALLFAKNGWITYASVRNIQDEGSKQLLSLSKEFPNLSVLQIDITKQEQVDAAITQILLKSQKIDVLVNNAGFGFLGPIENFTIEEIKEQFDTNVHGQIRMIKAVLPSMKQLKRGRILNISSINGLVSFPLYGVYSASKFALETMTDVLDFELHPFNIKLFLIEPGGFTTNFSTGGKRPKLSQSDTIYSELTKFLDRYGKASDKVPDNLKWLIHPNRVAERIYKIAATESYTKFRNIIGIDAHIIFFLDRVLPRFIKRYLLKRVYNW